MSHAQSMLTLSVFDLGRTGGTVSLRSVSDAGTMARGRDKAHHAQVVVHLLLHLLLLAPEFGRCAPPPAAAAAAEAST